MTSKIIDVNWLGYVIGAAVIVFFIFSVVSFIKSMRDFVKKKHKKNVPPSPEPEVNDTDDNLNKEV